MSIKGVDPDAPPRNFVSADMFPHLKHPPEALFIVYSLRGETCADHISEVGLAMKGGILPIQVSSEVANRITCSGPYRSVLVEEGKTILGWDRRPDGICYLIYDHPKER
jgi:hypothetical protein